LLDHLDGISYRRLEQRYNINKNKLCKIVNNQTANFFSNFEITIYFLNQLNYGGNLVLDGKSIPVKEALDITNIKNGKIPRSRKQIKIRKLRTIVWGIDYTTHDIPHFEFGESENGLVLNDYFIKLKFIKYPLISLTVDDKREIKTAIKRHYPDCIIQLCTKHYLSKISRKLKIDYIKIKIRAREKQIDKLFDDVIETKNDYLPYTRSWSIKRITKLINEVLELNFKYELLLDFQKNIKAIICAKEYQTAIYRIESLEKYFMLRILDKNRMRDKFDKEHVFIVKKLFNDFLENKKYLLSYLKHSILNIPRTTNLIEGLNSQLELRINSIKGFELDKTAQHYVNAWIIKRRFTKFTDCKKKFKKLNKKNPLECAGVDVSNVDNWIDFLNNLAIENGK
jgi:hypothetical protein